MKNESAKERALRKYYDNGVCQGLSKVFTPKEVRDKMTVHAEKGMKVLVMFNHEFCYDLYEKGIEDVTFVSDDELKNEVVRNVWGYRIELIDAKSINIKFEGMKFDLIISNPPYNKGLDLKILQSIKDLSDKICFVHPATWLFDKKNCSSVFTKTKRELNFLESYELINGQEIFNVGLFMDCSISFFDKNAKTIIDYNEIDKYTSGLYVAIKKKVHAQCNTDNLRKHFIHKNHISHQDEFSFIKDGISYSREFIVGFCSMRGNTGSDDFFTFTQKTFTSHIGYKTKPYYTIFLFNNKIEQHNFINYINLKISRFCLSILKLNPQIGGPELELIPWLDFSRSWTDEEVAKQLGITNDELLWIIDQIPDYYPEDKEKYEQLKIKLNR